MADLNAMCAAVYDALMLIDSCVRNPKGLGSMSIAKRSETIELYAFLFLEDGQSEQDVLPAARRYLRECAFWPAPSDLLAHIRALRSERAAQALKDRQALPRPEPEPMTEEARQEVRAMFRGLMEKFGGDKPRLRLQQGGLCEEFEASPERMRSIDEARRRMGK